LYFSELSMIYYEFLKFKRFMGFKSIQKKRKPAHSVRLHSAHGLDQTAMPACPARWTKAGGVACLAPPKAVEAA
jgi:hypothetical protein